MIYFELTVYQTLRSFILTKTSISICKLVEKRIYVDYTVKLFVCTALELKTGSM